MTGNRISNNGSRGVNLSFADNNRVYNNEFISNGTQARVSNSTGNVFNLSKAEGGGNHWSNWLCPDSDRDGFVDLPYVFSGGQDDFPLADSGCNDLPVAVAGSNRTVIVGETTAFDGSGSYDTDGDVVSYEWEFGDSTPTQNGAMVNHVYESLGIYIATLTVTDNDGGMRSVSATRIRQS